MNFCLRIMLFLSGMIVLPASCGKKEGFIKRKEKWNEMGQNRWDINIYGTMYTIFIYTYFFLIYDICNICRFRWLFQKGFVFTPKLWGRFVYFDFRLLFPDWVETTTYKVPKEGRFVQGLYSCHMQAEKTPSTSY